jgi:hypothetical protein
MASRDIAGDLIKGAVAGAVATWAMGRTTTWLYEREPERVRNRENEARGGQSAYTNLAESLAGLAGVELSDDGKSRGGTAIHWATGIVAGMNYAALQRYRPEISAGFGVPYGMGMYLVLDELLNPLLGLTPGPAAFPWQAHARGLAGHVVFGAVNDATLKALEKAA